MKDTNTIKVSRVEFNSLLNQVMILESIIDNLEKNNFKIEDSTIIRNYYSKIKENASIVIRSSTKKIVRIEKQNKHK